MSYQKAEEILPQGLLLQIQEYVDGQSIYIPKSPGKPRTRNPNLEIQRELSIRNRNIYRDYVNGISTNELADKYYLSPKSIQRIVRQQNATGMSNSEDN